MKVQAWLLIVFVVVFAMFASSDSSAAIYKYLDEDGMVCIADDLQSIPEQYRETTKIVSGEAEEEKPLYRNLPQTRLEKMPESTVLSPVPEQSPTGGIKKSFFANRVLISIIVVVSALFAFVILGIVDADHKKSVKITRMVILWGMSVYLIFAHAGDVVHLFRSTTNTIGAARQESVEKGKKAVKAMKELNALIQSIDNADPPDPESVDLEKND